MIGFRAVDALLAELPADTPPGRAAAGRRPPARGGGGRRFRAALRHGVPRGRRRERATSPSRPCATRLAADARSGRGRRARATWALRGRRQDDPRCPRPGGGGLRSRGSCSAESPAAAYAAAVRAAARGMRSTRPLVARRGLALRLGTAVGRPPRPGRRLVRAAAARRRARRLTPTRDRPTADGPARTGVDALERERRRCVRGRPARGRRAVRPVPAEPAHRVGRQPRRARRGRAARARPAREPPAERLAGAPSPASSVAPDRRPAATGGAGTLDDRGVRLGRAGTRRAGPHPVRRAAADRPRRLARRRTGPLDEDGSRIAQLARHELAVAFAGARLREALEQRAPRARAPSSMARPT